VGITTGYYLFNAAPYVLTLLILVLSSSATKASADMPAELAVSR
jgi:simple sugar transport system permease protein